MSMQSRTLYFAAALIGLAVAAATFVPVHADEAPAAKKAAQEKVLIDRRTTGSVCDPNDPNADIVCRVTQGNPKAKFPTAPDYPSFGF